MDDISDIAKHYNSDPELEDDRLHRHPMELARMGYAVTALDLSEQLLKLCDTRVAAARLSDRVSTGVCDARRLPGTIGNGYDAGLLMGPLYHLIDREDRQAAISEVVNRLLPGAPFFSSHINRYGMLTDVMVKFPHWAEDSDAVESVVSLGRDPDDTPRDGRFRSYFATVEEIESLHEECGIETILIAASDLGSNPFDRIHESMTDDQREKWIDLMQQAGAQPALRGASCHLLYIGRRPQSE